MNNFKVIIAGGRDYNDYLKLSSIMDQLLSNITCNVTVICGMANGADKLGERYAISHRIPVIRYPAKWDKYGKSAGYKRNIEMARNADALVAFWDGKSKGTGHMIKTAKLYHLDVRIITY